MLLLFSAWLNILDLCWAIRVHFRDYSRLYSGLLSSFVHICSFASLTNLPHIEIARAMLFTQNQNQDGVSKDKFAIIKNTQSAHDKIHNHNLT